jgi:glutathione S-transferase
VSDGRCRDWFNIGCGHARYTAIVTLLAVAFYFFLATRVAVARGKFDVKLPATAGHPDFERVFRVHQNTLEWMPTFLASLWLCAIYLNDSAAAVLGLVWIGGRALYFAGYSKAVEKLACPGSSSKRLRASCCLSARSPALSRAGPAVDRHQPRRLQRDLKTARNDRVGVTAFCERIAISNN